MKVGEAVRLQGLAEPPPEGGLIVRAEIDFVSDDSWPHQAPVPNGESRQVTVQNPARVRVVVTA